MKFRKRPIVIEAMRWPGQLDDGGQFAAWAQMTGLYKVAHRTAGDTLVIGTPNGETVAQPGDWVLKGAAGFYPCKHEFFQEAYEPA